MRPVCQLATPSPISIRACILLPVTLTKAGSQSVIVTGTTNPPTVTNTTSEIVTVTAATATQFILSAPASVTKGVAFSMTLTVEDAYGNVVTGYVGTVHFTSSDSTATLPANYTFTAANAGVHTFTGVGFPFFTSGIGGIGATAWPGWPTGMGGASVTLAGPSVSCVPWFGVVAVVLLSCFSNVKLLSAACRMGAAASRSVG